MKEFDDCRLNVGAERLAAIVRRNPNVERILCGHVHRPIQVRFIWSGATTPTPRWEQAFSEDGGETWETNWIMDFTRAEDGSGE